MSNCILSCRIRARFYAVGSQWIWRKGQTGVHSDKLRFHTTTENLSAVGLY